MVLPPRREAVAGQLAGVVAGVQVDEAPVEPHVVDPVRDHRARSHAAEVVVVDLDRPLRLDRPVAVEVADQLLLLRVDADHRQAGRQVLPLEPGDVLELGVAVRMARPHRPLLQRLPPAVSVLAEQLRDDVAADRRPQLGDPPGDLPPRQVGPSHLEPHRVAGGVVLEHLEEVGLDRRVGRDQPLASAPLFRERPVSSSASPSSSARPCRMVLGSHPRTVGDVLDPAVAQLGGLDGGIPPPVALLERVEEPLINRSTSAG